MAIGSYCTRYLHQSEASIAQESCVDVGAFERLEEARTLCTGDDYEVEDKLIAWIVAPVFAGFTLWLADNIRASKAVPLGVMREGCFIARLLRELCGIEAQELAVNRHFALLAAYAGGDDEALVNWLTRTRLKPLTQAELARLLPLYKPQQPEAIIDGAAAEKLIAHWKAMGEASPAWLMAQDAAKKLSHHWHSVAKRRPIALIDFAAAGNIQRSLKALLGKQLFPPRLIGFNFATTRGTVWAKNKGCEIYGFLAQDGEPENFAAVYTRAPEVIEVFAGATLGSLIDYNADGTPVWDKGFLTEAQQKQLANWQDRIISAAKFYIDYMGPLLTADTCRVIWHRFLAYPHVEEALQIGDWPLDAGLDGSAQRILAPALKGKPEDWGKMQSAWPAASALRGYRL